MGPFFHHLFSVCTFIIYCVYINVKHKLHGGEKNFTGRGAAPNAARSWPTQFCVGCAPAPLPLPLMGHKYEYAFGFALGSRSGCYQMGRTAQDAPQGRITNARARGCNYTAHPLPRCVAQDGVSVAGLFCARSRCWVLYARGCFPCFPLRVPQQCHDLGAALWVS